MKYVSVLRRNLLLVIFSRNTCNPIALVQCFFQVFLFYSVFSLARILAAALLCPLLHTQQ